MNAGADTLTLDGAITFATHTQMRERIARHIAGGGTVLDWRGVRELDSSALSLVFYARRLAVARGAAVRNANLPAALDALAELYGVTDLIDG